MTRHCFRREPRAATRRQTGTLSFQILRLAAYDSVTFPRKPWGVGRYRFRSGTLLSSTSHSRKELGEAQPRTPRGAERLQQVGETRQF